MFGIYLLINIQVLFLVVLWYMLFYIFESEIVNCWVMSNSLWPSMDCGLPKVLCLWDFPGKNTGVGSHFLLQGIFPTQRSNLLSYIAGNSLPSKPPGKPFYWDIIHILIILLTYNHLLMIPLYGYTIVYSRDLSSMDFSVVSGFS